MSQFEPKAGELPAIQNQLSAIAALLEAFERAREKAGISEHTTVVTPSGIAVTRQENGWLIERR